MTQNLLAKASTTINAPPVRVWQALVTPAAVKHYMFGTTVNSDWRKGSPITWKGEWEGKRYEDKGTILDIEPNRVLSYSHYSPASGVPDKPENYHTVRIELSDAKPGTKVVLTQDRNVSAEEQAHSEKNWQMMLDGLKAFVEQKTS